MFRIGLVVLLIGSLFPPQARAEGDSDIQAILARQMFNDGNYAEALPIIEDLARKGVPRAELVLARIYEGGLGVEANPLVALDWYQKAADHGQPQALFDLATVYEEGDLGVAQDLERARALYLQAAEVDYAPALHNLARMYLRGQGGPKDEAIARALFERAVALGQPTAIADYALILALGDEFPADLPKARRLYGIASAHEIPWAMRDYAEMLEKGEGGPIDLTGAEHWYRRAAGLGNAKAAYDMAQLLWANTGAMPDRLVEALAWCFWAEALSPDIEGLDYSGACAGPAAAYKPDEVATAREMAKAL